MVRTRGLVLSILLWFGVTMAYAGHYMVAYSGGGPATIVGPSNIAWSKQYATTNNGRGGGGTSQDPPNGNVQSASGYGSVSCSGPITATLTWDGGPNGDPAPKSVVILKTASASWSGASGGGANGLGDPATGNGEAGSSSGVEYELVNGSPTTITRSVSPSASASVSPTDFSGTIYATASVSFSIEVAPLVITLAGTSPTNGNTDLGSPATPNAVMIGSRVRGGINCDLASLSNHNWTVEGNIFAYFALTGSFYNPIGGIGYHGGHREDLAYGELQTHAPEWVWRGASATFNQRKVSCSVTVTSAEGVLGTGEAELQVFVFAPYVEKNRSTSTHPDAFVTRPNGDEAISAADPTGGGLNNAIRFTGRVGTPFFARRTNDPGGWNYVQRISADAHIYNGLGYELLGDVYPRWALDNVFPYMAGEDPVYPNNQYNFAAGTQWNADIINNSAELHYTIDNPFYKLGDSAKSFTINDEFQMYQMYYPPDNGLGSEYVPLARFDWNWVSSSSDTVLGGWSPNPSGTVSMGSIYSFPDHPQWADCALNQ